MQNFTFGGVTVLAVQLFNKIKKKKKKKKKEKKKKTKNMKNKFRCISGVLCRNTFIFGEFILFCMF